MRFLRDFVIATLVAGGLLGLIGCAPCRHGRARAPEAKERRACFDRGGVWRDGRCLPAAVRIGEVRPIQPAVTDPSMPSLVLTPCFMTWESGVPAGDGCNTCNCATTCGGSRICSCTAMGCH